MGTVVYSEGQSLKQNRAISPTGLVLGLIFTQRSHDRSNRANERDQKGHLHQPAGTWGEQELYKAIWID